MHVLIAVGLFSLLWFLFARLSPRLKEISARIWTPEIVHHDWTTLNGLSFERVEVRAIVANEVIFRHKLGIDCLPLALLNEEERVKLTLLRNR